MFSLIVPPVVLVDSDALSGCMPEQRIEQTCDKGQVDKTCNDSGEVSEMP